MSEAIVRVLSGRCLKCGRTGHTWRTSNGDVALPGLVPMAEVRRYAHPPGLHSLRDHCDGQVQIEMEPANAP